jgi:hypothetical protein
MSIGVPRLQPHGMDFYLFGPDAGHERWREWACGHNRSAEYDGSSTIVRRSWFGRLGVALTQSGRRR